MKVIREDGREAYFYPEIQVVVTKKGKDWENTEMNKSIEGEDLKDCVLLDLIEVCSVFLVSRKRSMSVSSATKIMREFYAEMYGDACGPKKEHVARAFKLGYIRFEIRNVPRKN